MRPQKPIYPPPWWSDCSANCAPCTCENDSFTPGDEFTICFVGYDSCGNALFTLKRPRPSCNRKTPCFPTRRLFNQ